MALSHTTYPAQRQHKRWPALVSPLISSRLGVDLKRACCVCCMPPLSLCAVCEKCAANNPVQIFKHTYICLCTLAPTCDYPKTCTGNPYQTICVYALTSVFLSKIVKA